METITKIFDTIVNTAVGRLLLLALVLGFVTQGLKKVASTDQSLKRAVLSAAPALIGMPIGLVPGFLPGLEVPISVLLCAVAGVACSWVFNVWSKTSEYLEARAVKAAQKKIDEVLPPSQGGTPTTPGG